MMENDHDNLSSEIIPHQQIGLNRSGRPPGATNKATKDAKAAIALFVEGNVHRLQTWLDMIAHGYDVEASNPKTGAIYRKLIPPNPQLAYELFMAVVEYHVPKMTRSEIKQEIDLTGDMTVRRYEFHDVVKT